MADSPPYRADQFRPLYLYNPYPCREDDEDDRKRAREAAERDLERMTRLRDLMRRAPV